MSYKYSKLTEHTPTITASSAYTADDQVGTLLTITPGMTKKGLVELEKIVVVDKASQSASTDIFFFDASPTIVSVDHGAFDISDAELVDKCIGYVNIPAANYAVLANGEVAMVKDIGMKMKTNTDATIYAVCATRGTPTYGTTSDLVFKFLWSHEG